MPSLFAPIDIEADLESLRFSAPTAHLAYHDTEIERFVERAIAQKLPPAVFELPAWVFPHFVPEVLHSAPRSGTRARYSGRRVALAPQGEARRPAGESDRSASCPARSPDWRRAMNDTDTFPSTVLPTGTPADDSAPVTLDKRASLGSATEPRC